MEIESVKRLQSLLWMAHCDVTTHSDGIDWLDASYATPIGLSRVVCTVINNDDNMSNSDIESIIRKMRNAQAQIGQQYNCNVTAIIYTMSDPTIMCGRVTNNDGVVVSKLESLRRLVIDRARTRRLIASKLDALMSRGQKIFPLRAHVRWDTERVCYVSDALNELQKFITDPIRKLCCVAGGFGTGKSVLLLSLVRDIENGTIPDRIELPVALYVSLKGVSSRGVKSAVLKAMMDRFGGRIGASIEELIGILGDNNNFVLVLDDLDEQFELDTAEVAAIATEVKQYSALGIKTILAFRAEMFRDLNEIDNLLHNPILNCGYGTCHIALRSLAIDTDQETLDASVNSLPSSMRSIALSLAQRPIWLEAVRSYARRVGDGAPHSVSGLVSYCLDLWCRRELRSGRPALYLHELQQMMVLLAWSLHTRIGIEVQGEHQLRRESLVKFAVRFLPLIRHTSPLSPVALRHYESSIDVVANGLAVANVLTIDDDGLLAFVDYPDQIQDSKRTGQGIFFYYFLACGIKDILDPSGGGIFANKDVWEVFSVDRREDFFGLAPLPINGMAELVDGMETITSKVNETTSYTKLLEKIIDSVRPRAERLQNWRDLSSLRDRGNVDDAKRTYEVCIPPSWPSARTWYTATNAVSLALLSDGKNSNLVRGLDFSFVPFHGTEFHNTIFRECNFTGSDFSFSLLRNIRFEQCRVSGLLFHKLDEESNVTFTDCSGTDEIVVTHTPASCFHGVSNWRGEEFLNSICCNDQKLLLSNKAEVTNECGMEPVQIPVIYVDRAPIVNADFEKFVKENCHWGRELQLDLENSYILAYFDRAIREKPKLPVVYVTLYQAAAYAIRCGRRLPNVPEVNAYRKLLDNKYVLCDESQDYWSLNDVEIDCPVGVVTEWTCQVDDSRYWNRMSNRQERMRCGFPHFRRDEGMRCEYHIIGESYYQKRINVMNSKLATWVNPDQGFRCVQDYCARLSEELRSDDRKFNQF